MNNNLIDIITYIPMVKFIASILAEYTEVVLYDLKIGTIIAIETTIGEKKIGDTIEGRDLVILEIAQKTGEDFIINNSKTYKYGEKLKQMAYFIRHQGEIIGMISIIIDSKINKYFLLRHMPDELIDGHSFCKVGKCIPSNALENESIDNITYDIEGNVAEIISRVVNDKGIDPERMNLDEKVEIVYKLNNYGLFSVRGAVSEVAKKLKTSEPTIYRYLQKIIK